MTADPHEFLALGLYAAEDDAVLSRYYRAMKDGDDIAKALCETELYYRGMGTRLFAGGFSLETDAQKKLAELRRADLI